MSEENAEVLRRAADAFNDRGLDAYLEYVHPEVEWWTPPGGMQDEVYRGHEGVRRVFADLGEIWTELRTEIVEIHDAGEEVVVVARVTGKGQGSGLEVSQPWAYRARLREGKIDRVMNYADPAKALEAAGLGKSAGEPGFEPG